MPKSSKRRRVEEYFASSAGRVCWSNVHIAKELGVSHTLVGNIRGRMQREGTIGRGELNPGGIVTYFIQGKSVGNIKIGRAADANTRLSSHQCGSGEILELIGVIYDDREREIHDLFANCRLHGEWFRPDPSLLAYIRENCCSVAKAA